MATRTVKSDSGNDLKLSNNGDTGSVTITDAGVLTIVGDWTAASQTCANLGTVTTADINGGTWQGTIDGSWTAASQTCANLGTVTTADLNGGSIDGMTIGATTTFPAGGTGNPISVAVIVDQKGETTDAGASDSDAGFATRELNTKHDPDSIATLSSNQITLGAGTYFFNWSCPAIKADRHSTVLRDVTGVTDLMSGSSEYTLSSGDLMTGRSMGSYIHTIAGNNIYEVRQMVAVSCATYGLGIQSQNGVSSIYTIVVIYKLK